VVITKCVDNLRSRTSLAVSLKALRWVIDGQKRLLSKKMLIRRLLGSEKLIALLLSAMRFVNSRDCSNGRAVAAYEEEMRALLEFLEFIALNRGKLQTKALLSAKRKNQFHRECVENAKSPKVRALGVIVLRRIQEEEIVENKANWL